MKPGPPAVLAAAPLDHQLADAQSCTLPAVSSAQGSLTRILADPTIQSTWHTPALHRSPHKPLQTPLISASPCMHQVTNPCNFIPPTCRLSMIKRNRSRDLRSNIAWHPETRSCAGWKPGVSGE